jgi:Flp pilus assembly pilin Flp
MRDRVIRFLVKLYCREQGAQFAEYGVLIVIGVAAASVGVATYASELSAFFAGLIDNLTTSPTFGS